MKQDYPLVHYHIYSGDGEDVPERLDKGLSDFGIVFTPVNDEKHNAIRIPLKDEWGILMRRDSPLSEKESISPSDLNGQPLIISRQQSEKSPVIKWLGRKYYKLNNVSTYNLVYNASVMVKENIGYALVLDKLINVSGDSELCFRPLKPPVYAEINFIWNKYQIMTKSAAKSLEYFRAEIDTY